MPKLMRRAQGMTFIELMIAVTIFLTLGAALLAALLVSRTSYLSADASVQAQEEVRRAFDSMVRELHGAGNVNGNVDTPAGGVQRLDFQIVRNYDAVACAATAGVCWGSETAVGGWIHYVLDAADANNPRYMRCVTAPAGGQLAAMPGGFAGCRVLANRVNATLANTAFLYVDAAKTVTVRLLTTITSDQLPGGSMNASTAPLLTQVRLRNDP